MYEQQVRAYFVSCDINTPQAGEDVILLLRGEKFVIWKLSHHICHKWNCVVDRPFRSTKVNLGKKNKCCSLSRC